MYNYTAVNIVYPVIGISKRKKITFKNIIYIFSGKPDNKSYYECYRYIYIFIIDFSLFL